jgi:NAD(P)-dependent dehydrogenase (short-subunit alcohol dehydrogenase family)
MERLRGRGVIVTGATGIAAASARRLAAEGAVLVVVSRTEAHCRDLIDGVTAAGGRASYVVADLTDGPAAAEAAGVAVGRLGRVDGLLNVAGGSGRRLGDGPLHELTAEAFEATLRLNATSHVAISAPILRAMLGQEPDEDGLRGSVVNMGSVLASRPVPSLFPTHAYAMAKGAIASLTVASAAYYAGHGIRVNMIAPALTVSRMSERAAADEATVAFSTRKQPIAGGFIAAEDVADAALYLLSRESRSVTGQTITVDGGWSIIDAG